MDNLSYFFIITSEENAKHDIYQYGNTYSLGRTADTFYLPFYYCFFRRTRYDIGEYIKYYIKQMYKHIDKDLVVVPFGTLINMICYMLRTNVPYFDPIRVRLLNRYKIIKKCCVNSSKYKKHTNIEKWTDYECYDLIDRIINIYKINTSDELIRIIIKKLNLSHKNNSIPRLLHIYNIVTSSI